MTSDATAARPRGRPPLVDPVELRRRAIDAVARHGYATVSMAQVARESGVSLRTLHRHFASKADLVWGGLDESVDALRQALARADPDVDLLTAIEQAIVAAFETDDPLGDATDQTSRTRLRLIATSTELQESQSESFRQWREDLVAFTAARLGVDPDGVVPTAIAAAAQAATMAGLTWWATHDDDRTASEVVGAALRALRAPADPRV